VSAPAPVHTAREHLPSAASGLRRAVRCAAALAALAGAPGATSAAEKAPAPEKQQVKVVYHLTEGLEQAVNAMRNVRNHLAAEPGVKIVIVANGRGIDFLLDGAKDKNGNPFDATVQDLVTQGVEFRACQNTLTVRKIDPSKLLPEATLVPSGVAEAARLQSREGYAYIRP
jgi:intracellular sulfur oxidation DsrE/DsrF family protein